MCSRALRSTSLLESSARSLARGSFVSNPPDQIRIISRKCVFGDPMDVQYIEVFEHFAPS